MAEKDDGTLLAEHKFWLQVMDAMGLAEPLVVNIAGTPPSGAVIWLARALAQPGVREQAYEAIADQLDQWGPAAAPRASAAYATLGLAQPVIIPDVVMGAGAMIWLTADHVGPTEPTVKLLKQLANGLRTAAAAITSPAPVPAALQPPVPSGEEDDMEPRLLTTQGPPLATTPRRQMAAAATSAAVPQGLAPLQSGARESSSSMRSASGDKALARTRGGDMVSPDDPRAV
jgi:hypothetical protein